MWPRHGRGSVPTLSRATRSALTLTRHGVSQTPVLIANSVRDGPNAHEQKPGGNGAAQARDRQTARPREVARAAPGKRKPGGKEVAELPPAAVQAQHEIDQPADRGNLEAVGKESDDLRTAATAKLRGK